METIANHSDLLRLDLQFFSDDVILPDDFETPTETVETEEITEPVETVEDTTPTEQTEELTETTETPIEQTPKIKVKYNHQEMELPVDEAVPLIQKGMNYDKALERAQQEARDAFVASQNYEWNGKPITTEAEYKQALMEQELMQKYQSQNLPDEVIQELVDNRKFRETYESKQAENAREQKKQQEFNEFITAFPDVKPDTIPNEVWEMHSQGIPLKFAYMQHEYSHLKDQVKVLKQNKENEQKAPTQGVTSHGSTEVAIEDDFLRGFNSI